MEGIGNQFETLKSRVFYGDKDSAEPRPIKYNLTEKTHKTLENYDKEMSLTNRKIGTRMNYFKCLRNFFFYLCGEKGMKTIGLENLTKEDLLDFFHHINNGKMSIGTKNIHRHVIKKIYMFMEGGDEYPATVKWIKFEKKPKPKLPKNLITEEQIWELIKCASKSRDKALISMLLESGARVSEVLAVNMEDMEFLFDEETKTPIIRVTLIDIKGHTGERRVELFDSVPYIQNWINEHPKKNDPNSPLFICMNNGNFGQRIGRNMVWRLLDSLGKRAQLENVTLNPHSFRHRALTEKGKFMSKFELAKFAGHTMNSSMVNVYINLEDKDINNKLRQARGLAPIGSVKEIESALKTKTCECGELNPGTAMFCNKCRKPLDKEMWKKYEKENTANDFMNFAMKNPEVVKLMTKMMEMFVRQNKENELR